MIVLEGTRTYRSLNQRHDRVTQLPSIVNDNVVALGTESVRTLARFFTWLVCVAIIAGRDVGGGAGLGGGTA